MTAHKHAASMVLYAQDAAETEEPWLLWESAHMLQVGRPNGWQTLREHPDWAVYAVYRRKPKTIRIGEFDVPEPMRESPAYNTKFYTPAPDPWSPRQVHEWTFTNHEGDHARIAAGFAHLSPVAAELHAKALLSFTAES